jgi:hypothetical protein
LADDILLQAPVDPELYNQFVAVRDRFGWTNRETLMRVLEEALPRWEKAPLPSPVAPVAPKR